MTLIKQELTDIINYSQKRPFVIDTQMWHFWLNFGKKLQGKSDALIDLMGCSIAKSKKIYNNDIENAELLNMTDELNH
jgi:hypothetical protein